MSRNEYTPGFNAGQFVKPEATPTPAKTPVQFPATQPAKDFSRTNENLPASRSSSGRLEPAFAPLAKVISAQIAQENQRNSELMSAAFPLTEDEKAAVHRDFLAQAVKDGTLTEALAQAEWVRAHGNLDPATLKPKS